MDLNKLKDIATKLKSDKNKSNFNGEYPQAVFIPDGIHKGRFIVDPEDEVYHKMFTYGYFARGIEDPAQLTTGLPEGFDRDNHPLRQLANILMDDYKKWGRGSKFSFLTYYYLVETDAANEDWQPGNLYCLIGNGRFADAFTDMLSSLVSDSPEHLLNSLNPAKEGPIMQITFQHGAQGKCSISPTFKTSPPIVERTAEDTDETYNEKMGALGYRSLKYSYIYPGFSQEKYDALCKAYEEELQKLSSGRGPDQVDEKKPDTPAQEEKKPEPEKPAEKPVEEKKEETPATPAEDKPAEPTASESTPSTEEKKEEAPAGDDPFAKYRRK